MLEHCGTEAFKVVNTACNKNGRILILDAELNDTDFLLISFYYSDSESEQLPTFYTLQKLLEKVDDCNENILFLEVILMFFDCKFHAAVGNLISTMKSLLKLI